VINECSGQGNNFFKMIGIVLNEIGHSASARWRVGHT
jgi:hypothetical protein